MPILQEKSPFYPVEEAVILLFILSTLDGKLL